MRSWPRPPVGTAGCRRDREGTQAMKYLALAVAAVTVGAFPALADEHTDAVMMMAEATICKISVSEGAKRILYGKISSGGRTPSQVNYEIHGGIEALKK